MQRNVNDQAPFACTGTDRGVGPALPYPYQPNLRFNYVQTLSRWFAKAVPPNTVFIGDSITSAGMQFNSLRSINLGSSGLQTYQIAGQLEKARSFEPRHISVMAGTNDAGETPIIVEVSLPDLMPVEGEAGSFRLPVPPSGGNDYLIDKVAFTFERALEAA